MHSSMTGRDILMIPTLVLVSTDSFMVISIYIKSALAAFGSNVESAAQGRFYPYSKLNLISLSNIKS